MLCPGLRQAEVYMSNSTKKWCHSQDHVPKGKHYAIVIFSSYTVPGDERSRQCPGHGYPEHSEDKAEYIAFTDRAEWEAEVQRMSLATYKDNFVALVVDRANVTTEIKVKVD